MLLEVECLKVKYGQVEALHGVSFNVDQGEIVTVIGANGAGKTTALTALSGLLKPSAASIKFEGKPIEGLAAHRRVELGMAHVPEGRRVFSAMTVAENLEMGAFLRAKRRSPEYKAALDDMLQLFPILGTRSAQLAGNLSGGEQQMLAIARALIGNPRLLLLDEPSLGLAPLIVKQIFEMFDEIRARGVTFLLVEQNVQKALTIADRAYVLESGEITREGSAVSLLGDEAVHRAYLGGNVAA